MYTILKLKEINVIIGKWIHFFVCRATAVERSMILQTKAMRDRQELREMRKYRFSLMRSVFILEFVDLQKESEKCRYKL